MHSFLIYPSSKTTIPLAGTVFNPLLYFTISYIKNLPHTNIPTSLYKKKEEKKIE